VKADAVFGLSGAASISFLDLKKNLEAWERIETSFEAALYREKSLRKLSGIPTRSRRDVRWPSGRRRF
jgi:hypothetical protein